MAKATINDVELFYDEHGSGEPILIHHGYTGSHYTWDDVVPHLANVIADFARHGVVTAATLMASLREPAAAR